MIFIRTFSFNYGCLNIFQLSSCQNRLSSGIRFKFVIIFNILLINNFKNIFDDNKFNVFADDAILIVTSDNLRDLMAIGNRKLSFLDNFLKSNGISINEAKMAYMIFSPKWKLKQQIPDPLYYMYFNKPIEYINIVKLLGISID